MRLPTIPCCVSVLAAFHFLAGQSLSGADAIDMAAVRKAAGDSRSVHLDSAARIRVAETFRELVAIKGGSGDEGAIRDEVRKRLVAIGAREIPLRTVGTNVPVNLAMEIPATAGAAARPGILLNAHIDTLVVSTPDRMVFDPGTGDFHHAQESEPGVVSSFGGDDRSGVTVVVESVRWMLENRWKAGGEHPRIVLLFTGSVEVGLKGAKYLARTQPELFKNLAFSLTIDGPLDLQTAYPTDRLVTVVSDADASQAPYKGVLSLVESHAKRAGVAWKRTEVGLGAGDFAAFPPEAKAGLHLRSPVRGWHRRERVQVQDLVHHVDLVVTLLGGS